MAVFQTITINGYSIPYPNDFQMRKVPNIVAEINTLSGTTIADVNGWKYDDTTLKWDTLVDADLVNLINAIAGYTFPVVFKDLDGTHTETAVLRSRLNTKTPLMHNGMILWKDIEVTLGFPTCHQ